MWAPYGSGPPFPLLFPLRGKWKGQEEIPVGCTGKVGRKTLRVFPLSLLPLRGERERKGKKRILKAHKAKGGNKVI